jgi:acetate kinase
MRAFAQKLPGTPQVAAFETGVPPDDPAQPAGLRDPAEWTDKLGVRKYGFHGASHRYIATRVKELVPAARKVTPATSAARARSPRSRTARASPTASA